jgi:secretion/DNA translocation related TadE-like protein
MRPRGRAERERGSVSIVVVSALVFVALFATFAADLALATVAGTRAQTAADAAALAAAQELIFPSGRPPDDIAAEYAEAHGAQLVSCRCDPGGSDVVVTVEIDVVLLGQARAVQRTARAIVESPPGTEGLDPRFAAGLSCLLSKVSATVISGFRTHAEQALLYRLYPDLAAPPGHSMHELGLAADLAFPSSDAGERAHGLAPACGLIFPYPHEPWHVELMMAG